MAVPGPDHVCWRHMHSALSHCTVNIVHQCMCITKSFLACLGNSVYVLCRTAQSEAEKLRSQVEKLQHENRMLRMRLGEDAPKQEPVTPRMHPSLLPSSVSAQDFAHLDLFRLSLVHIITRHVLPQYSCVAS